MMINAEDLPAFKKQYTKAVKTNKASFHYLGQEVVTSYAKYVIEYLESLKPRK